MCSAACTGVSRACGSCGGKAKKSSFVGRLIYAVILLLVVVLAWVLKNLPRWIDSVHYLNYIPGFHGCTPQNSSLITSIIEKNFGQHLSLSVPEQLCYGTMSVYRASFALAVFHAIFALVMIGVATTRDKRHSFQHSWWSVKLLVLAGILIGAFFIPNTVFVPYGWVALVGSGLFILIQLVLLVDFAHTLNESWIGYYEKSEGEGKGWLALLLGSTFVLYAASLVGVVLMYVYFTDNPKGCWFNPMFITLNLILCAAVSLFSIHPGLQAKNPRIGLLQSAVVTAYCTYLVWSALSSQPATMQCSSFPLTSGPHEDSFSMIAGLVMTFLALVYSAFRASGEGAKITMDDPARKALLAAMPADEKPKSRKSRRAVNSDDKEGKPSKTITDPEAQKEQAAPDSDAERSAEDPETEESADEVDSDDERAGEPAERNVSYNYSFFHVTFALAAMYLAMVLTNWESVSVFTGDTSGANTILVDQGMVSVWVKVISSWLTLILYTFSMLAPICFPNRDF